jgi:hypothetical protein
MVKAKSRPQTRRAAKAEVVSKIPWGVILVRVRLPPSVLNLAQQGREKIVWPTNLVDLVNTSSCLAVAKLLGVSDKAVKKRLNYHS